MLDPVGAPGTFTWPMRVYYHHTDAGRVVNHAKHLDFMEAARTELLAARGCDLAELAARNHVLFMVYALAVDHHRSAWLNGLRKNFENNP